MSKACDIIFVPGVYLFNQMSCNTLCVYNQRKYSVYLFLEILVMSYIINRSKTVTWNVHTHFSFTESQYWNDVDIRIHGSIRLLPGSGLWNLSKISSKSSNMLWPIRGWNNNSKVTHCLGESDFHYSFIFIPYFCNTCNMKTVDLKKVCTWKIKTPKPMVNLDPPLLIHTILIHWLDKILNSLFDV